MASSLNISVFVSGRGSNLHAIHEATLRGELAATLRLVVSNRQDSAALDYAAKHGIATVCIAGLPPGSEEETRTLIDALAIHETDFIALAGYLRYIPSPVVSRYRHRIVNIHPALLPSFGGQGMYGHRVHEAVLASGVKLSGVTVHLVNEEYDEGPILMQECVPVLQDDTTQSLAARVLEVEHRLYPEALKLLVSGRVRVKDNKTYML
jgi:phosphoribosylglycinamide formyltransferase 1